MPHTHTHSLTHIYTPHICSVCVSFFVFFVRHFLWLRAHKKRIKWLQHGIKNAPKSANREREREGAKGEGVGEKAVIQNEPSRSGHFWVVNDPGQ